jgi:aldoxime dehydratase
MQVLDGIGAATEKTFGQAYFTSLGALEKWAEHHPTHLAIFGTFMHEMAPLGDAMQLRLWHEVMVLPAPAQSFEYVNCHDRTGLMGAAGLLRVTSQPTARSRPASIRTADDSAR